MNLFLDLFRVLVYEPQLNVLYLIFQLTGKEIGLSFILIGVVVSLITLPLFIKTYITGQKNKILAPKIAEIREKYKKEPQVMLTKMREFNKKHGIDNGSFFIVILVQLFFVSGLYYLIKDVVAGNEIKGLYEIFWGKNVANFKDGSDQLLAFGRIDIGASAKDYLWLPLMIMVFSYLYGMYTFRWAPKPQLPEIKKPKKPKNSKDEPPLFDPETFQKSMEFQQIYIIPLFIFIFNYTLPIGLNIYFATTGATSLIRQIFLTRFYARHTDELIRQIVESDPTSKDSDPSNNLEITADPNQLADNLPVAEKILEQDKTRKDPKSKSKKQVKPSKSKNTKTSTKKASKKTT